MPRHFHQNNRFLDKSFNEQETHKYVLSLTLSVNGLAACIYDPSKNKILGLLSQRFKDLDSEEEISAALPLLLNTDSWLVSPFSRVNLIYDNKETSLIPTPLFHPENAPMYLEFNHVYPNDTQVFYDQIKHIDAAQVYGIPKAVVDKVKTLWPNPVLRHASSILIETLDILTKNQTDNNTLFLNIAPDSFELVYFRENKLHYYNRFLFHTETDFIYFLLSAMEQLELNPESVNLVLLGAIDKRDAFFEIVYRYIRNITFVKRNDNFLYSYVLDEMKPHTHFVLFNSLQCE